MKRIILLSLLLFACSIQAQEGFVITGRIEGATKGKVEIKLLGFKHSLFAKIKDGKFKIEGELKRSTKVLLRYKEINSVPFYIENSTIDVTFYKDQTKQLDATKKTYKAGSEFYNIRHIQGSLTENLFREYKRFESDNKDRDEYKYLIYNYLDDKISMNPTNYLYVDVINNLCRRQQYLNYAQLITLLQKLDLTGLDPYAKDHLISNIEKLKNFGLGKVFPTYTATNLDGELHYLYKSYSKYTLIDFWASWCKPCRAKNPELKEIYAKYKDKGFNIIGISNDRYKDKWKLAIEKDGLTWSNFHSEDMYKKMMISSIPYTYLIDENAKIVGINLSTDQIEKILKSSLK